MPLSPMDPNRGAQEGTEAAEHAAAAAERASVAIPTLRRN
jgi:hypothetical protein